MDGKLYLVATPIGNLEDITLRAIRILKEVDIIAAEDTRHTLQLLNYFEIKKPLISYYRHNEEDRVSILIEKLKNGENIAIVSDAGTPGICDPGEKLVKQAIEEGIEIVPIPGACAFVNALIASGLETKEFAFYGFLPVNKKLKKKKIEEIQYENKTIILYEAPHKLKETLKEIQENMGDIQIVLAKELTKLHEQFWRGKISEILEKVENIKGEFVVILEKSGCARKMEADILAEKTLEEHYDFYKQQNLEKKEIIKKIAKDRKMNRNEVYQYFLNCK